MKSRRRYTRADLARIATAAMTERGLEPEFSEELQQQLARITGPGTDVGEEIHDLTGLLWCSIDNDDSLDLDQLTVSEALPHGAVKILVAIDDHARTNTTSVYTAAHLFPMLPEKLSTNLTSLNPDQNRARQRIEELMILPNECTARFLAARGGASLRRVVGSPERWLRIVEVAKTVGESLPTEPSSRRWRNFWPSAAWPIPCAFPI